MASATAAMIGARASSITRRAGEVEGALEHARAAGEAEAAHAEHRQPVEVVELHGGADDLEQPRQQAHADADRLGDADEVERVAGVGGDGREDHAVHVVVADERAEAVGADARRQRVEPDAGDDLGVDAAALELAADGADGLGVAEDQAALGRATRREASWRAATRPRKTAKKLASHSSATSVGVMPAWTKTFWPRKTIRANRPVICSSVGASSSVVFLRTSSSRS